MPSNEVVVVDLSGLLGQKLTVMIIGSDVSMHIRAGTYPNHGSVVPVT